MDFKESLLALDSFGMSGLTCPFAAPSHDHGSHRKAFHDPKKARVMAHIAGFDPQLEMAPNISRNILL